MNEHYLNQKGPAFCSFRSPYYAFVFDDVYDDSDDILQTIVIYDPESKKEIYTTSYGHCYCTSIAILRTDAYIGLENGRILEIKKSVMGKYEKFVRNAPKNWSTDKKSVTILGINNEMFCVATSSRKEFTKLNGDIIILSNGKKIFHRKINGAVKAYKFDFKSNRLFWITRTQSSHTFHEFGLATMTKKARYKTCKLEMPSWPLVKSMAISINGEIAFSNGYRKFCILTPGVIERPPQYLEIGNKTKKNSGGSSCFVGEGEEYLVYCGRDYPEIAVAKRINGEWINQASPAIDMGSCHPKSNENMSNIQNIGTDGKKLILHVGPDGCIGEAPIPNVLCVVTLEAEDTSKEDTDSKDSL
jgi:hypothetical protein